MYSLWWLSSEGTTGRAVRQQDGLVGAGYVLCTVDIYLVLLHELAELGEPVGGVDLFHVEQTEYGGLVEGSGRVNGQTLRCICGWSRVGAPEEAREQHGWLLSSGSYSSCMRLSAPRLQPGHSRTCLGRLASLHARCRTCQAIPPARQTTKILHRPPLTDGFGSWTLRA